MYFSPTTFAAKLLAVMQVLMTLDVPLSTTMALPVTSKPIESTVENLAWQAWIELPPEQKQQVKSRKVTPKSIFTLPLRVECPEGHKQVDSKCIPIAIGSNDVLIDLNALGLLVGNTPTEDLYDYDDMGEELANPLAFGGDMAIGEAVKSSDGLAIDLKPPAKDEPLKFNIFQNKFHIFHEEPLEDYAAISNEGLQSSEKEQNITVASTAATTNATLNTTTSFNDLVSEASNISENNYEFFVKADGGYSHSDYLKELSETSSSPGGKGDFKIEAISVPASSNHSSIHLVTSMIDEDVDTSTVEQNKQQESDFTTLLQTESFMPLLNHTTATTLHNSETLSLTTLPLRAPSESFADQLNLNIDEEITTLSSPIEQNAMELKNKQEYTRSVTLNPILAKDNDSSDAEDNGDNDQLKESTLEVVTNDEPLETTTPIQLDETTIIESNSSVTTTTRQQELKELLLQQEQAQKDFEELQRMRKGQKDQHVVLKKSKVQPVEVLATTTTTTTMTTEATTTATTIAANLPTATKTVDELIITTAETATPLLTVHNENENNDRFYYQHFNKQENEVTLRSASQLKQKTAAAYATEKQVETAADTVIDKTTTTTEAAAKSTETERKTFKITSEIDLAEELRLINELVKGIRRPTTTQKTITKIPTTITTTTTTTTPSILADHLESTLSSNSLGESSSPSSVAKKPTLTTSQIWSKILPLLTTTTITPVSKSSANESRSESEQNETTESTATETATNSVRSNRNSKIIRINGFNRISAAKFKIKDFTTEATTTTTTIPISEEPSPTTSSSTEESSTESDSYDAFWWLPVSWRLNEPTSTEKQPEKQDIQTEEQPLLLRFWSAYTPRSS